MCSPANATKWMSYLAEGLLAEEDVQPSLNPFFWCTNQQSVEQPDCRYVRRLLSSSLLFSSPLQPRHMRRFRGQPISIIHVPSLQRHKSVSFLYVWLHSSSSVPCSIALASDDGSWISTWEKRFLCFSYDVWLWSFARLIVDILLEIGYMYMSTNFYHRQSPSIQQHILASFLSTYLLLCFSPVALASDDAFWISTWE